MKIAYLANTELPSTKANSLQIMKMCEAFKRIGHHVSLIVPTNDIHSKDVFGFYNIRDRFDVIEVKKLSLRNGLFRGLTSMISALKVINRINPHLIYSRNYSILFFLKFTKFPVILELHQINYGKKDIILKSFLKPASYKGNIVRIVSISENMKKFWINWGMDSQKLTVAHDGVDISNFRITRSKEDIREEFDLPKESPLAIYIGSFYPDRGIDIVLEVVRALKSVYFLMVGGNQKDLHYWNKYIKKHKLTNVRLEGFINNHKVSELLYCSNVLLMPYTSKVGTKDVMSPMKLFEYMASGTPIVSSDFPVLREILDESNSVLVEPDNPEALSLGIKRLIDKPEFASNIAQKALERVKDFTWEKRAEKVLEGINIR